MRSRSRSPVPSRHHKSSRGHDREHRESRREREHRDGHRDSRRERRVRSRERSRSRSPPPSKDRRPAVDDFGRERRRERSRDRSPPASRGRSPSRRERKDRDGRSRDDRRSGRGDRSDRGRDRSSRRSRSPVSNGRERERDRRSSSSAGSSKPNGSGPSVGGAVPNFLLARPEITEAQLEGKTVDEQEMMKLMGFGGFDTTKGKKVSGNDVSAVNLLQKRKYRQYMNRKGGFNRPLDFVA